MKPILSLVLTLLLCSPVSADDEALGGAKEPKPEMTLKRNWQSKRVHQLALRYILLGRLDDADSFLNDYLKDHPDDAETHYMLGVLRGQQGQIEQGLTHLEKAVELGLPAGRIVAGPREVMQSFEETEYLRETKKEFDRNAVHGPLIGNVTDNSATFWVRVANESSVRFAAAPAYMFNQNVDQAAELLKEETSQKSDRANRYKVRTSKTVQATAESDLTGVATITGLEAETEYFYRYFIDDQPSQLRGEWLFRTFPKAGKPSKFSLAFGGGAGFVPENERMWDTIDSFGPRLMLLLGDNVYIDDPESPVMQQYTYHRRQSRPEWRRLTAHTPTFTIWDDHDFSVNDSWGGPHVSVPEWKIQHSWPIFQQNWANPPYESSDIPGCWYSFKVGDVDFVMLDCRYYRTDPEGDDPTMLGPEQLAWLKKTLNGLTGTFKVICSSVPWDYRTKGDSLDTWNGYKSERDTIFDFLDEHDIEGVLLFSADRHRSDAWRIDREGSYPLYEFNSSRLTNQHVHKTMEDAGALFSYNAKQSFGLVEFDTTLEDPTAIYTVINIDGERVHDLTVRRSELQMP